MSFGTLFEECERVLGWWTFGVVSETEVIEWADSCLDSIFDPPDWLIELSLQGPTSFTKAAAPGFPRARSLNYSQKFRLLVETTDSQSETEVRAFASWAAREAMGEDMELPEVKIGYEIDHAESYEQSGDPLQIARAALDRFRPDCTDLRNWKTVR